VIVALAVGLVLQGLLDPMERTGTRAMDGVQILLDGLRGSSMRVLLTGAFGNVGQATLDELLAQGHQVCCFDLPSPRIRKQRAPVRRTSRSYG